MAKLSRSRTGKTELMLGVSQWEHSAMAKWRLHLPMAAHTGQRCTGDTELMLGVSQWEHSAMAKWHPLAPRLGAHTCTTQRSTWAPSTTLPAGLRHIQNQEPGARAPQCGHSATAKQGCDPTTITDRELSGLRLPPPRGATSGEYPCAPTHATEARGHHLPRISPLRTGRRPHAHCRLRRGPPRAILPSSRRGRSTRHSTPSTRVSPQSQPDH